MSLVSVFGCPVSAELFEKSQAGGADMGGNRNCTTRQDQRALGPVQFVRKSKERTASRGSRVLLLQENLRVSASVASTPPYFSYFLPPSCGSGTDCPTWSLASAGLSLPAGSSWHRLWVVSPGHPSFAVHPNFAPELPENNDRTAGEILIIKANIGYDCTVCISFVSVCFGHVLNGLISSFYHLPLVFLGATTNRHNFRVAVLASSRQ